MSTHDRTPAFRIIKPLAADPRPRFSLIGPDDALWGQSWSVWPYLGAKRRELQRAYDSGFDAGVASAERTETE